MEDKNRGLYRKYAVERTDGKPVGTCFVLELKDPNTWPALAAYAETVRAAGYKALAVDIEAAISYADAVSNATPETLDIIMRNMMNANAVKES